MAPAFGDLDSVLTEPSSGCMTNRSLRIAIRRQPFESAQRVLRTLRRLATHSKTPGRTGGFAMCCQTWTRTKITSSRGMRPTIRRSGNVFDCTFCTAVQKSRFRAPCTIPQLRQFGTPPQTHFRVRYTPFMLPHQSDLTVQKSRCGLGIFTERAFARGETLFRVEGPFVRCDIDDDMDPRARNNTFRYDTDRYISPAGTIADYLNHSCEPNARVRKHRGTLRVIALKRIPQGTEVTIDYSTITAADDAWIMRCRCSTPSCRKIIRSFNTLPTTLQKNYIRAEIVPTYILAINRAHDSSDNDI